MQSNVTYAQSSNDIQKILRLKFLTSAKQRERKFKTGHIWNGGGGEAWSTENHLNKVEFSFHPSLTFLQSAPKSHQLRNGLNNLGWGTKPAIWICLSMTKVNAQNKYFSVDHFLLFSSSCCSRLMAIWEFRHNSADNFLLFYVVC